MVDCDMGQETERGLPLTKIEKIHYALSRDCKKRSSSDERKEIDEGYSVGGISDQYDCVDSSEFCTGKAKEGLR